MAAQFESIFKELGAAAAAGGEVPAAPGSAPAGAKTGSTPSAATAPGGADFQDTIRRTMERMQASGESATAAATAEGSDDFMAEMLRQMGGEGGMEGNEEEFSKMLLGMMEQLTNKDILYEPMKELNDKFPEWMEKNRETISAEDRDRYDVQQALVKEIVGKFEETGYADSNTADREYIVERMQKVSRDCGARERHVADNRALDASRGITTTRSSRRYAIGSGRVGRSRYGVLQPTVNCAP